MTEFLLLVVFFYTFYNVVNIKIEVNLVFVCVSLCENEGNNYLNH